MWGPPGETGALVRRDTRAPSLPPGHVRKRQEGASRPPARNGALARGPVSRTIDVQPPEPRESGSQRVKPQAMESVTAEGRCRY